MQYAIHQSVLPPNLRDRGAKVWVGDSVLNAGTLEDQGMRAIAILMLRDVYGEISIVFAVPAGSKVTPREVAECRHCALEWILKWHKASDEATPN